MGYVKRGRLVLCVEMMDLIPCVLCQNCVGKMCSLVKGHNILYNIYVALYG